MHLIGVNDIKKMSEKYHRTMRKVSQRSLCSSPRPPSYRSSILIPISQTWDTRQVSFLTMTFQLLTKSYFFNVDFGNYHLYYILLVAVSAIISFRILSSELTQFTSVRPKTTEFQNLFVSLLFQVLFCQYHKEFMVYNNR